MAAVITGHKSDTMKSEMFPYSDLPYGNSIHLTTGFKLNDMTACLKHGDSRNASMNSTPNKLKKLKKRRNMRPVMFDNMTDNSDSSCKDHTRSCESSGETNPMSPTIHKSLKDCESISPDLEEGPGCQNCFHYSNNSEKSDTGFTDTYEDRSCGTDCESFVTEISSLEAGTLMHPSSSPFPRRFIHMNVDSNWETDSCITDYSSFEVQQYEGVPAVRLSGYDRFCVDHDVTVTSLCSVERETTLESVSDDNEHETDTGSSGSTISGFSLMNTNIQGQGHATNKDHFFANMSCKQISEELGPSSDGTRITEAKHKSSLTSRGANRKFNVTDSSSETVNIQSTEYNVSVQPKVGAVSKNVCVESDENCVNIHGVMRSSSRYVNQYPLLESLQSQRITDSASLSSDEVGSKDDIADRQDARSGINHDWVSVPETEHFHSNCSGSNAIELSFDVPNVINERMSVTKQQKKIFHETNALTESPRQRSNFFADVKSPCSQGGSSHRSVSLPNVYFGLGRTTKCPWHYNYHVQELCLNTSSGNTSGVSSSGLCHFDKTVEVHRIKHKHKHSVKPKILAYRFKCKMNTPHPSLADKSNMNDILTTRQCDHIGIHRQDGRERCHDDENHAGLNHSRDNRHTRIQMSHSVSPQSQNRQVSQVVEPVSMNMRLHIPNPYNKLNHRFHSTLHCPCFIFFCFLCCYPAVFLMQRSDMQFISDQQDLARQNAKRSTVLYIIGGVTSVIFLSTILFVMYFFLGDKLLKSQDS